jgi:hypothetical protein
MIRYLWWQYLKMQWTQKTFECIFGGYHAAIIADFNTGLTNHPVYITKWLIDAIIIFV